MDNKNRMQTFVKNNQIEMVLIISLGLFVLTIVLNPKSFNVNAFGSILSLTSMLTIAAAGQTLVVIADGIDMSLGDFGGAKRCLAFSGGTLGGGLSRRFYWVLQWSGLG